MKRTELDENSFSSYLFDPNDYTTEAEFENLIKQGYNYSAADGCKRWIRKDVSAISFNSLNCKQFLSWQLKWLEYQNFPGTSSNPLSIDVYNVFARWNLWFGGYVRTVSVEALAMAEETIQFVYKKRWS